MNNSDREKNSENVTNNHKNIPTNTRKGKIVNPSSGSSIGNKFKNKGMPNNVGTNLASIAASKKQEIDIKKDSSLTDEEKSELLTEAKKEQKKETRKVVAKGLVKFLIKNPWILAILAILLLIFIFSIYLIQYKYEMPDSGITDYDELETISGNFCTTISLIKEHDKYPGTDIVTNIDDIDLEELFDSNGDGKADTKRWSKKDVPLEDYVKGVVKAEAERVNDEKVFEVASVMARTYALEITSKRCFTWDNENIKAQYKNPQNYVSGSVPNKISKAVSKTSGIVAVESEKLYDMSQESYYDNFCYKEIVYDEKIHSEVEFEMLQEGDNKFITMYGDWVKENVVNPLDDIEKFNNSGKYDGQCQKNGVGLYIAKSLVNNEDNPFSTKRVLNYFYGYDVELRKIKTLTPIIAGLCMDFDLYSTTLTKEQFVSLVNSYNGGTKYARMAAIADQIYDMSIANGLNPELVITRAIREGFSGGNNNYWGINAPNGKSGNSYNSLSEGAMAFINVMVGYKASSLYEVYDKHHYAFIGAKWFKNGNGGLGGCYYLEYIAKYYTNQSRLAEARASCAAGTEIPTNAEDQSAYSMWQVEMMQKARKDVFGIESTCDENQNDSWDAGTKPAVADKDCNNMLAYLFPQGVPQNLDEANSYQTYIDVPVTNKDGTTKTVKLLAHRAVLNDIKKALTDAQNEGFVVYDVQTQRDPQRCITEKQGRKCGLTMSQHCYGLAVDINVAENPFTAEPRVLGNPYAITRDTALYKSFTSLGWGWGGDFNQPKKDYMHFSYMGS